MSEIFPRLGAFACAAAALAAPSGCVVDNPLAGIDGGAEDDSGADADADDDTDTGSGTDTGPDAGSGEADAGTYLACSDAGDIVRYDAEGAPVAVEEDCPDENGLCAVADGGAPACLCSGHFGIAAGCAACETGWGGEACAVCEIGYGGPACDVCTDGYVPADGACAFDGFCGSDDLWRADGALPGDARPDPDFAIGGTESETTAVDLVTGLEWQRCYSGTTESAGSCAGEPLEVDRAAAVSRCLAPFGGHADWRIPEAGEIQSLFDYLGPAHLNESLFTNPGGPIWSSTAVPGERAELRFALSFANFEVETPAPAIAHALCVRDVGIEEDVGLRFAVGAADGSTAIDAWTGREWRRCEYGRSWEAGACAGDAQLFEPYADAESAADDEACVDAFGGHDDWRVPTVAEMESLISWCDPERQYHVEIFGGPLTGDELWTSTVAGEEIDVFYHLFSFPFRRAIPTGMPELHTVLCVRELP